jgi:hypothetical protein
LAKRSVNTVEEAPVDITSIGASSASTDVHDPNYYDWKTFMAKKYLEESEIQQYEKMDSAEIGSVFFQLGVAKGAQLFFTLLHSYRLAARVANAAFGFVKAAKEAEGEEGNKSVGEIKCFAEMEKALHDYSPSNFTPHASDSAYAGECFEAFYEQANAKETKEEVLELIFEWTCRLQEETATKKGTREPITPADIVARARE